MLTLKKKTESVGLKAHSWHPDFRDRESLPDTKVVRTAFFVNGLAVLVALSLLIYVGLYEVELHSLRNQIEVWEQNISRDQSRSNIAIAKFRKFQKMEAKVDEAGAFVDSRPSLAELMARLGRTLPKNLALDSLDLRDNTLTLHATVRGAPDKASGYASNYVEVLRNAPEFAGLFEKVSLTKLSRVASTGRLAIEVIVELADPDQKGKGK